MRLGGRRPRHARRVIVLSHGQHAIPAVGLEASCLLVFAALFDDLKALHDLWVGILVRLLLLLRLLRGLFLAELVTGGRLRKERAR